MTHFHLIKVYLTVPKMYAHKIFYDRLTFPYQVHKTKFVFLNNHFNEAGNSLIKSSPISLSNDIYFQFIFMYCKIHILIFPGNAFHSTDNI